MRTIQSGHPDASDAFVLGKNLTPEERQNRDELAEAIDKLAETIIRRFDEFPPCSPQSTPKGT